MDDSARYILEPCLRYMPSQSFTATATSFLLCKDAVVDFILCQTLSFLICIHRHVRVCVFLF